MSVWAACRYCLSLRPITSSAMFAQIRHKTYVSKSTPKMEPVSPRDILVYAHKRGRHVAIVMASFIAASTFLYSTASSLMLVGKQIQRRREEGLPPSPKKSSKGFFSLDMFHFKDGKYHKKFAYMFYALGTIPLLALLYLPPRYVRAIVMLKDGKNACFTTYAPFGSSKHITIPVSKVSAMAYRSSGESMVLLSKNHYVPFYLSRTGTIMDPPLLDKILRKQ